MKKYFLKILFFLGIVLLFITKVYAFELKYSDWSDIYPDGVDEILIEREDRFRWFKESEYDVEYLKKEDIGDKLYDENDIQYYESEESETMPEEYSERVINTRLKAVFYKQKDVKGLKIVSSPDVEISEIIIKNNLDNITECVSEKSYLSDNVTDVYYPVDDDTSCYFDKKKVLLNLNITIYLKTNSTEEIPLSIKLVAEDGNVIFKKDLNISGNKVISTKGQYFDDCTIHHIKYYSYIDKLYRTYRIKKEYEEGYFSNLDGYIKDEESIKTFYRYIINDYIILDEDNNLVTNEDYCTKEFCRLVYIVNEPQEEIIENPKTYDDIWNYIFLFIVSVTIIIVKICHTIKKSNIVESI